MCPIPDELLALDLGLIWFKKNSDSEAWESSTGEKYPKKILADNTDNSDTYDDLHDLVPSYIESTISDKLSLYHVDEEEDYESKFDNGLSIKTHKLRFLYNNVKWYFCH